MTTNLDLRDQIEVGLKIFSTDLCAFVQIMQCIKIKKVFKYVHKSTHSDVTGLKTSLLKWYIYIRKKRRISIIELHF